MSNDIKKIYYIQYKKKSCAVTCGTCSHIPHHHEDGLFLQLQIDILQNYILKIVSFMLSYCYMFLQIASINNIV